MVKTTLRGAFNRCRWSRGDWTSVDACGTEMEGSILSGMSFVRCTFRHLVAGHLICSSCTFRNTPFDDARFPHAQFTYVTWEHCAMHSASFLNSALKHVCFTRCSLRDARIINSTMEHGKLVNVNEDGLILRDTVLKNIIRTTTARKLMIVRRGTIDQTHIVVTWSGVSQHIPGNRVTNGWTAIVPEGEGDPPDRLSLFEGGGQTMMFGFGTLFHQFSRRCRIYDLVSHIVMNGRTWFPAPHRGEHVFFEAQPTKRPRSKSL